MNHLQHINNLMAVYTALRLIAQERYEAGKVELAEICESNEYPFDPQEEIMQHSSPYQALLEMTNDIESMLG